MKMNENDITKCVHISEQQFKNPYHLFVNIDFNNV